MKEKLTQSVALLMLAWYCLCLVGFDVHTCRISGESVLSPLVVSSDCEDLHHHDSHHHHSGMACRCCLPDEGHSDCEAIVTEDACCSDDILIPELAATESEREEVHSHHGHCTCHCGLCPDGIEVGRVLLAASFLPSSVPIPDENPLLPSRVERSAISVWRL
ncbi:MAG: hypothetical protein ACI395_02245 [Candidatus Cryptobacteroides sp.]